MSAFADYEGGREPFSDTLDIEEEKLTDGSHAYNVILRQPDGSQFRFQCVSEEAAWGFADDLVKVSGVACLVDRPHLPDRP